MQINLPILDRLTDSHQILIAGVGGGLPLYLALRALGKTVHLANFSFTEFTFAQIFSQPIVLLENQVIGARPPIDPRMPYYPEGYLAQWFKETRDEDITVWAFAKTGAVLLVESYTALIQHLNIDALILVDGGVDSIMRGDEARPGTLIEDAISLTAVDALDIPVKLLVCLGFGTEVEEDVCHHHALENIAALAKAGGFLGSCALVPQMEAFQQFESACRYVWEQGHNPKSHITARVIPAVNGEFGNHHMYPDDTESNRTHIFVSPLMSLYWFFDAHAVIAQSLIIDMLRDTHDVREAFARYFFWVRERQNTRPRREIPY
jgi:hypothetical protein